MLDAVKVLFILTGASTYLVTKYINVGIDNSTDINHHHNSKGLINLIQNGKINQRMNYLNNGKIINEPEIDSISNDKLLNDNTNQKTNTHNYNGKQSSQGIKSFKEQNDDKLLSEQPTYEIEITEEDETDLPRKLLQVKALTLNNNEQQQKQNDIMFMLSGDGINDDEPEKSKFAINAFTGELFLIAPIDRDAPYGKPKWKLNITAEDGHGNRLKGWASIVVNVIDINDNQPKFTSDVYYGNISEKNPKGTPIVTVSAHDPDQNDIIRYSIELNRVNNNGELIFEINSTTGLISTSTCCFDRESIDRYLIKVSAWNEHETSSTATTSSIGTTVSTSDAGEGTTAANKSNKAIANVIIFVNDVNDSPCKFEQSTINLTLDQIDIIKGKLLTQLKVLDQDLPWTNKFQYKILEQTDYYKYFTLIPSFNDKSSVSLMISQEFHPGIHQHNNFYHADEEVLDEFSLIIAVTDQGDDFKNNLKVDYCQINIQIVKKEHEIQKEAVQSITAPKNMTGSTYQNIPETKHQNISEVKSLFEEDNFKIEIFQNLYCFIALTSLLITSSVIFCYLLGKKLLFNYKYGHRYQNHFPTPMASPCHQDQITYPMSSVNEFESSIDQLENYNYEGGGEVDMQIYDLTQLRIPLTKQEMNSLLNQQQNQRSILLPDVCNPEDRFQTYQDTNLISNKIEMFVVSQDKV